MDPDAKKRDEQPIPLAVRLKFHFHQTWRFFLSFIAPIVLLLVFTWKPKSKPVMPKNGTMPPPYINRFEQAPYGLYVVLLMATYWVSECIPMPVTSLLPVILLPLFGLAGSDEACSVYFNHVILFLFAGCVVALSFEYSNLHKRIALFVMQSIGAQPSTLLFGMMFTCMGLSCWMNNTSTSAMMVPVVLSVMDQYRKKLMPEGSPEELATKFGNPDALPSEAIIEFRQTSTTTMANSPGKSVASIAAPVSVTNVPAMTPDNSQLPARPSELPEDSERKSIKLLGADLTPEEFAGAVKFWEHEIASKRKYLRRVEIMLLIGVAVGCNIGGTGVITGTGTNLIAASELSNFRKALAESKDEMVKNKKECLKEENQFWVLDFVRWIVLNALPMIVNTFFSWCFLALYFDGLPRKLVNLFKRIILRRHLSPQEVQSLKEKAAASVSINLAIKKKYQALGKTSLHEWLVIILFLNLVCLWILKNPLFLRGKPVPFSFTAEELSNQTLKLLHPICLKKDAKLKIGSGWGWARFFGDKCDDRFIHDYVPTLLTCFLMFVLPKDPVYYKNILRGGLDVGFDHPVLPFDYVAQNIPWGPLFMLGGGFGLAAAIRTSALGDLLKEEMQGSELLTSLPTNTLLALVLVLVAVLTTIASNTAVAVILAPVLLSLSSTVNVPPLYLLVPAIVSASYAFILPISTPPNAIVYDKGNMKQMDMVIPGFFLTIICNGCLYLFTITWYHYMLGVGTYSGACNPRDGPDQAGRAQQRYLGIGAEPSLLDDEGGLRTLGSNWEDYMDQ